MGEIIIDAEDVWAFFNRKGKALEEEMALIAQNTEYGIDVWLTREDGNPAVYVYADDVEMYEETMLSEADCKRSVRRIYEKYLTNEVIDELLEMGDDYDPFEGQDKPEDVEEYDPTHDIEDRENQLDDAITSFLIEAGGDDFDARNIDLDDIVADCKEHFLEYLARKHNFRVYRPMFLEADDGTEFYTEYPYEQMIFDD